MTCQHRNFQTSFFQSSLGIRDTWGTPCYHENPWQQSSLNDSYFLGGSNLIARVALPCIHALFALAAYINILISNDFRQQMRASHFPPTQNPHATLGTATTVGQWCGCAKAISFGLPDWQLSLDESIDGIDYWCHHGLHYWLLGCKLKEF